jgi:exopolysaccharide production protein ExoQ
MPPQLALLLALGFIACAYFRENKRRGEVSAAVWIATLWMMRCGSRGLDEWRGGGVSDDGGGNQSIDQLFIFTVAVLGFVVVARRWSQVNMVLRRNVPVVIFFCYITLSVIWSQSPFDSIKQLFRAFGDLSMVLLIVTESRPLEAMLTMFRRGLLLLIPLSVVCAKYYPELGRMREKNWEPDSWIGVSTHKNCLGQICFLAAIVFVIEIARTMRRRKFPFWQVPLKMPFETIYIAMTVYLLNGGSERSTTSILCVGIAIGLFFLFEKLRSRPRVASKVLLGIVCAIALLNVAANFFGASLSAIVAQSQGKDPTLTGRTELWADIIDVAKERPIFGAGFMSFWTPEVKAHIKSIPRESWGPEHADNGYVETYAQLGWLGLLLIGLLVIHGYVRSNRALVYDFDYACFRLVLLVTALLQNLTESGFPRPTQIVWFTFLLVVLDPRAPRPPRSTSTAERQELTQLGRARGGITRERLATGC